MFKHYHWRSIGLKVVLVSLHQKFATLKIRDKGVIKLYQ